MNNAPMMTFCKSVSAALTYSSLWALAGVSALGSLSACDKSETNKTVAKSSVPSAPPAPTVTEAPVIAPAPADLDMAALEKDLGCPKTGPKQSCRIIKEFSQSQRFTAHTPSGEGRWIGQAFIVEKGTETERELILWAKSVPTSQVGPGDLPFKVGYEFFTDELKSHAAKLVRALSHGDPPSPKNQAFPYAKALVPTKQRTMINTSGQSVHVTSEESIYLRARAPHSVFLVNPSNSRTAAPGDGMYAELWLADW